MTKLKTLKKKKKANNLLSPPTFLPHEFLVIEVPEMLNEVDKKSNLCNCDRFENAPSLVVSISDPALPPRPSTCLSSSTDLPFTHS